MDFSYSAQFGIERVSGHMRDIVLGKMSFSTNNWYDYMFSWSHGGEKFQMFYNIQLHRLGLLEYFSSRGKGTTQKGPKSIITNRKAGELLAHFRGS